MKMGWNLSIRLFGSEIWSDPLVWLVLFVHNIAEDNTYLLNNNNLPLYR